MNRAIGLGCAATLLGWACQAAAVPDRAACQADMTQTERGAGLPAQLP